LTRTCGCPHRRTPWARTRSASCGRRRQSRPHRPPGVRPDGGCCNRGSCSPAWFWELRTRDRWPPGTPRPRRSPHAAP